MSEKITYRIGVSPECPVHQITVGGHCFPRRSETVSGYGAETKRVEMQGMICQLSESDIADIKGFASTKVIRCTKGRKPVARVHCTKDKYYRKFEGDEPVMKYLFIHKESIDPTRAHNYATLDSAGKAQQGKRHQKHG